MFFGNPPLILYQYPFFLSLYQEFDGFLGTVSWYSLNILLVQFDGLLVHFLVQFDILLAHFLVQFLCFLVQFNSLFLSTVAIFLGTVSL